MKTNKKELTVFALCAYAIPFLMMPLLYICLQNGRDTSIFANAQMFYPAAGVMLAFLLARRQGTPKRFYILHIVATALMLAMSVLSAFLPQESWLNIANFVIIIASVLGWIFLLTEKKTKREDYGLRLHGKLLTALVICVYFLAVKTAMVFLSMAMQGGDSWAEYLAYWRTSAPWVMAVVLVPNFFLSFLPFFGFCARRSAVRACRSADRFHLGKHTGCTSHQATDPSDQNRRRPDGPGSSHVDRDLTSSLALRSALTGSSGRCGPDAAYRWQRRHPPLSAFHPCRQCGSFFG